MSQCHIINHKSYVELPVVEPWPPRWKGEDWPHKPWNGYWGVKLTSVTFSTSQRTHSALNNRPILELSERSQFENVSLSTHILERTLKEDIVAIFYVVSNLPLTSENIVRPTASRTANCYSPFRNLRGWGSQNFKIIGTWNLQGCQSKAPATFTARQMTQVVIYVRAWKTPGPLETEPSTCQLIAAGPQPMAPQRTPLVLYSV
jgi:hypothetical protein